MSLLERSLVHELHRLLDPDRILTEIDAYEKQYGMTSQEWTDLLLRRRWDLLPPMPVNRHWGKLLSVINAARDLWKVENALRGQGDTRPGD